MSSRPTSSCSSIKIVQSNNKPDGISGKVLHLRYFTGLETDHLQNSAGSAGMAAGGFFFFPLSHIIGRSSAIFWSLIGTMLSQVWASQMTSESDYNGFIVSRFFKAFFGSVARVLGPRILVDLFFLHQRGIPSSLPCLIFAPFLHRMTG
jgi:MFS family permease